MLPNYLILGAQKAGTTFLYEALCTHPLVIPSKVKEVHFFDHRWQRGTRWYRRRFPTGGMAALLRRLRAQRRLCRGEATPYYLFHPLAADRIKSVLPDAKLIVILRNPIHRAHSHHQHNVRHDREPLSFRDAIAAEPERLAGEEERLRSDPGYQSYAHQHYSYVKRGEYAAQLAAYLERFPRKQIWVLQSEELFAQPDYWISRTFEFLDLPNPGHVSDARLPRNAGGSYENIDTRTYEELAAHYSPHNDRLVDLLGRELTWRQ